MTKSTISLGGYTWWVKDWASDERVFDLNLSERGLYRELIDIAMVSDNLLHINNYNSLARKWNSTPDEIKECMETLKKLKLIIWVGDDYIKIPSCEKRLKFIRAGRSGGKQKGKQKGKQSGNQTETETETEKETDKRNVIILPTNLFSLKECKEIFNSGKVLNTILFDGKYKNTFNDFATTIAKANAFGETLDEFNVHLYELGELTKTKKEYGGHFHNWVRKQRELDEYNRYPWQKYKHNEHGKRLLDSKKNYIVSDLNRKKRP